MTIYLAKGGHGGSSGVTGTVAAGRLMERKARLCGCADCRANTAEGNKTDSPTCTNRVITKLVQAVQDRLTDDDRQSLVSGDWAERIDRCRRTTKDRRINVRIAIALARAVL